MTAVTVYHHC